MTALRLRFENGHFVPLESVDDFQEGDIIEIRDWAAVHEPITDAERQAIDQMLARTAGLWADWPEDAEGLLDDARRQWDELWQERLKTLTDF